MIERVMVPSYLMAVVCSMTPQLVQRCFSVLPTMVEVMAAVVVIHVVAVQLEWLEQHAQLVVPATIRPPVYLQWYKINH